MENINIVEEQVNVRSGHLAHLLHIIILHHLMTANNLKLENILGHFNSTYVIISV